VLDGVIVIAAFILNPRARKRRELEATTVLQANAPRSLSLTPTIVGVVEDSQGAAEKEGKEMRSDESPAQLNCLEAGNISQVLREV
jgi:hypothetical protein